MIAAANIVLIAIVMCLNWGGKAEQTDATAKAVAEMEAVLNRALAAYNAGDRDGFLACFSTKTGAATDAEFFSTKIEAGCRRDFGTLSGDAFMSSRMTSDGNGGTLIHGVQSKRRQAAQLAAEFVREAGAMKLVSWRIESP